MDPIDDYAALRLALKLARAESEAQRRRFDDKIADDGWEKAAKSAAYHRQVDTLNLKPWQSPPCHAGIRPGQQHEAQALAHEMESLGISRWHPDPLAAIEAAKAKSKAKAPVP
jgi:hypothetical protein